MPPLARLFIIFGIVFLAVGGLIYLSAFFHIPWGHLPGDIHIQGKNADFYFPLATCILVSVILSILINLALRIFKK
ncbi:MAG: DUF2905 domain-containing protein [Anaerolineales bacterium]